MTLKGLSIFGELGLVAIVTGTYWLLGMGILGLPVMVGTLAGAPVY